MLLQASKPKPHRGGKARENIYQREKYTTFVSEVGSQSFSNNFIANQWLYKGQGLEHQQRSPVFAHLFQRKNTNVVLDQMADSSPSAICYYRDEANRWGQVCTTQGEQRPENNFYWDKSASWQKYRNREVAPMQGPRMEGAFKWHSFTYSAMYFTCEEAPMQGGKPGHDFIKDKSCYAQE